jgi:alkanesulfonate monooxygenase SsuD/methylene tetrahydromethanopterin reductase-like flavin-dependent oxidoreductase (luciferase family)
MRVGVTVPLGYGDTADGRAPTFQETLEFARIAEISGLDSLWVYDHLIFRFPPEPEEGLNEAWTTLTALAALVPRVELGALVMCTSFRNAGLLAKMAATLDDLSVGRLILGLGCGWHEPEYQAFGYPFDHLVGRFEEDLEVITRLLRSEEVTS